MIRSARIDDARELAQLAARTFSDAFGADNRPADLAAHLTEHYSESQQRQEIEDPQFTTLIAMEESRFIGFAQLRRGVPPPCVIPSDPIELYRFYLDRSVHGTGVAQRLMTEVKAAAREIGARQVWLGVWEQNPRAKSFYAKCGFVDVGSKHFMVGADRQSDRVMVAPAA